jgi:hypothetical protein
VADNDIKQLNFIRKFLFCLCACAMIKKTDNLQEFSLMSLCDIIRALLLYICWPSFDLIEEKLHSTEKIRVQLLNEVWKLENHSCHKIQYFSQMACDRWFFEQETHFSIDQHIKVNSFKFFSWSHDRKYQILSNY